MIKKIDHLFEEIKYHEKTPPPFVWEQIEAELHRRNKRPVVAWWHSEMAKKSVLIAGVIGAAVWSYILSTYIQDPKSPVETVPVYIEYTTPKIVEQHSVHSEVTSDKTAAIEARKDKLSTSHTNTLTIATDHTSEGIDGLVTERATRHFVKNTETINEKSVQSELISKWPAIESGEAIKIFKDNEWIELKTVGMEEIIQKELAEVPAMRLAQPLEYTSVLPNFNLNEASKATIKPGFYVTPSIGVNITQVYFNSEVINPYFTSRATFSGRFGHQVGVQVGYQFNNHWSIESGVFYNQYQQSFKEYTSSMRRDGIMFIDQLDIPLMVRYSLFLKKSETPTVLSFKAGLNYGSVFYYQVNTEEMYLSTNFLKSNHYDLDKRVYNSIQLGYALGVDIDAYISKRVAFNSSIGGVYQSQYTNFPFFNKDKQRPSQLSGSFSVGIKFKF